MTEKKYVITYPKGDTHISLEALAESWANQKVKPKIFNPPLLIAIWTCSRDAKVDGQLNDEFGMFQGVNINSNHRNWNLLVDLCKSNRLKIPPVFHGATRDNYTRDEYDALREVFDAHKKGRYPYAPKDFETLSIVFEANKKKPSWSIWAKFSDGSEETKALIHKAIGEFNFATIMPLIVNKQLIPYRNDLIAINTEILVSGIGNSSSAVATKLEILDSYFYINKLAPLLAEHGIDLVEAEIKGRASKSANYTKRPFDEFKIEKIKHKTFQACADTHGVTRQAYSKAYRDAESKSHWGI